MTIPSTPSALTRRDLPALGGQLAPAPALPLALADGAEAAASSSPSTPAQHPLPGAPMSYVTTKDGTQIFYKDWGSGKPVVFSHGWPLSSDAWEDQMLFLGQNGFRVIAHDRRGHGRSSQSWNGNDMASSACPRSCWSAPCRRR